MELKAKLTLKDDRLIAAFALGALAASAVQPGNGTEFMARDCPVEMGRYKITANHDDKYKNVRYLCLYRPAPCRSLRQHQPCGPASGTDAQGEARG